MVMITHVFGLSLPDIVLVVYLTCSLLISLNFPLDIHIDHIYFIHFSLHWFGTLLSNSVPSVVLLSS